MRSLCCRWRSIGIWQCWGAEGSMRSVPRCWCRRERRVSDMTVIVGSGDFRFTVEPGWAKLPDDWDLKDVGGVAVDAQDRVFVFNRGDRPMIVLDREGVV